MDPLLKNKAGADSLPFGRPTRTSLVNRFVSSLSLLFPPALHACPAVPVVSQNIPELVEDVKANEGALALPSGKLVVPEGTYEEAVSVPMTSTPVSVIRRRLVPFFEKAIEVVLGPLTSRYIPEVGSPRKYWDGAGVECRRE